MTKKCVYELPIIGLRGSDTKETQSDISKQNKNLEEQKSHLPAISKESKRQRTIKARKPFVTRDQHLEWGRNVFLGKAPGEHRRAIFQPPSIHGPIYLMYNGNRPTPKGTRPSNYNLKVKHMNKIKSEKSNLGLGEYMSSNLQKKIISTEQLLQKVSGKTSAKCSASQSVSSSVPQQCNKIHQEKSSIHLTHQRKKVLKSISSKSLPTGTSQLRSGQKEAQQRSQAEEIRKRDLDLVAKGTSINHVKCLEDFQVLGKFCEHQVGEQKKPAVKENIDVYVPHCEPVKKQRQWNSGQLSRCQYSYHQTGPAAQLEVRGLKSTIRKNLTSHMASSTHAQVPHPPTKNYLSVLSSQKAPAGTSLGTIPAKKPTMLTRPLPWILPKSKYSMTTDCKPGPTSVRSSTSAQHAAI